MLKNKHLNKSVELRTGPNAAVQSISYGKAREIIGNCINAGQFKLAEFLARQLSEYSSLKSDIYVLLGHSLYGQKKHDPALEAVNKALSGKEKNKEGYALKALILLEISRAVEAESLMSKALAMDPTNARFQHNLALILSTNGKREEAFEAYSRALKLNNKSGSNYWGRTTATADMLDASELEQMISQSHNTLIDGRDRAMINFAIAKEYSKKGDVDLEWQFLTAANDFFASQHEWNNESVNEQIDSIIEVFKPELFDQIQIPQIGSDISPVFICTLPRSGSTLIDKILGSHSLVTNLGESGLLASALIPVCEQNKVSKEFWLWNKDMLATKPLTMFRDNFIKHSLMASVSTPLITEKSMNNDLVLPLLALVFPNAKFIYLNRNPLDICLSCYQLPLGDEQKYSYKMEWLADRYEGFKRIMTHWQQQFPDRVLELNYEDLVQDQKEKTVELLNFCGLEWEDSCLDFHKNETQVLTSSNWQVRQPIYKGSINRWEKYEQYLTEIKQRLA